MTKSLGFQLIIYSVVLAGLSALSYSLSPTTAKVTLIAGLAGAALCAVCGLLAVNGSRRKLLPALTLAPVCYVMIGQAVMLWDRHRGVGAMVALLAVLTLTMLIRIAYAGVPALGGPNDRVERQPDIKVAAPVADAKRRGATQHL